MYIEQLTHNCALPKCVETLSNILIIHATLNVYHFKQYLPMTKCRMSRESESGRMGSESDWMGGLSDKYFPCGEVMKIKHCIVKRTLT